MINAIHKTQQQYNFTVKQQNIPSDIAQQQKGSIKNCYDTCVLTKKEEAEETFWGLTNAEWKELGQKYDVENLTQEEKKALAEELKEKGVLDENECLLMQYAIIPLPEPLENANTITIGEHPSVNPENKNNFLKHFDELAVYCDWMAEQTNIPEYREELQHVRDIYLKLADISDKIAEEREKVATKKSDYSWNK